MRPLTITVGVVLFLATTAGFAQPIINGDFSDTTGAPWTFTSQATDATVSYTMMDAVVTGSDAGAPNPTRALIQQNFMLAPGMATITFDWSYFSTDAPGFDSCIWNLTDLDVNTSVIGGTQTLTDATGNSGTVTMMFTGGGNYRLRLGTASDDNVQGPGVSTFDNVVVTGIAAGQPFVRGDVNDDGGVSLPDAVVLLGYLFPQGAPTTLVCDDAGDANDDGALNLTDAIAILTALFGQPAVPLPGPAMCGPDPSGMDALDCSSSYTSC